MLKKKYSEERDENNWDEKYDESLWNAGHYQEVIDNLEDIMPDKRTKQYHVWKRNINRLMSTYNNKYHHVYTLIK